MQAVERTDIMDWLDFTNEFNNYSETDSFIFRGQSNGVEKISAKDKNGRVITTRPLEWELISSFNRYYQRNHYNFATFLSQQLENTLFEMKYGNYEFVKRLGIAQWSKLDKVMFLQHYGCPTCFIDFTKDPFIALYFAIASMKGSSGKTFDGEGNICDYSDDCFLSVYKIDFEYLKKILNIKEINSEDDLGLSYRNHELYLDENSSQSAVVSLLLHPEAISENYNLGMQKGSFLLYDSHDFNFKGNGFEKFISEYITRRKIEIIKPLIKIYRISYNSIYTNRYHGKLRKEGLFSFLFKKQISGAYLFNDLQGLKYDFNFFHDD